MSGKVILLTFTTPVHHHAALYSLLRRAIAFYEAPGGIHIRLFRSTADLSRFVEVVEYTSAEAWEKDQKRVNDDPQMQSFLAQWRALHAGEVTVDVYDDITGLL